MAEFTSGEEYAKNLHKRVDEVKKELGPVIANDVASSIARETSDIEGVEVTQKDENIKVGIKGSEQVDDVVDLKKLFAQSPKRKDTEGGGWHMVIPIRRYTGRQKEVREKSTGMSNRLYTGLLNQPIKRGYADLVSDFLYDNRREGSAIPELNYKPKSKNITRFSRRGGGHTYVSFRTVSDKSHPASWVINRSNTDPDNKTAEVRRIIKEVEKYHFNRG